MTANAPSRYLLSEDRIATAWYNALADLPGEVIDIRLLDLQAYDDFNHGRLIEA
jgi:predicted alternative tryptophan synthase beta-subunit